MTLSLFLPHRTDSSWKQMFCLSFIVRSTFQSEHMVGLGSTTRSAAVPTAPVACGHAPPGMFSMQLQSTAQNPLPRWELPLTQACTSGLAAASAQAGSSPRAVPWPWQQDFMALSRGHVCPSLQVSYNCPQVSVQGMLWPAGSQPGKQDVQGAGHWTTEIFLLLNSPPFFFFFFLACNIPVTQYIL